MTRFNFQPLTRKRLVTKALYLVARDEDAAKRWQETYRYGGRLNSLGARVRGVRATVDSVADDVVAGNCTLDEGVEVVASAMASLVLSNSNTGFDCTEFVVWCLHAYTGIPSLHSVLTSDVDVVASSALRGVFIDMMDNAYLSYGASPQSTQWGFTVVDSFPSACDLASPGDILLLGRGQKITHAEMVISGGPDGHPTPGPARGGPSIPSFGLRASPGGKSGIPYGLANWDKPWFHALIRINGRKEIA
jgi:cell wall-associated NlpC family hydrolase